MQLIHKLKQDVLVADKTGIAKIKLWEEQIGIFELGRSYMLEGFITRSYLGSKYLSKGGGRLTTSEDIGNSFQFNCRQH